MGSGYFSTRVGHIGGGLVVDGDVAHLSHICRALEALVRPFQRIKLFNNINDTVGIYLLFSILADRPSKFDR